MDRALQELKALLETNKDKRITVIGTTCAGKTTLLKDIPEASAIADVAPPLTEAEKEFYYHAPLTRENNKKMIEMRAGRVSVRPGHPLFGTAIAKGTELIIYLTISDELLKKRTKSRGVDFTQAKTMQGFIEEQIMESGLPVIKVVVG